MSMQDSDILVYERQQGRLLQTFSQRTGQSTGFFVVITPTTGSYARFFKAVFSVNLDVNSVLAFIGLFFASVGATVFQNFLNYPEGGTFHQEVDNFTGDYFSINGSNNYTVGVSGVNFRPLNFNAAITFSVLIV